jgi:hypothetical protein
LALSHRSNLFLLRLVSFLRYLSARFRSRLMVRCLPRSFRKGVRLEDLIGYSQFAHQRRCSSSSSKSGNDSRSKWSQVSKSQKFCRYHSLPESKDGSRLTNIGSPGRARMLYLDFACGIPRSTSLTPITSFYKHEHFLWKRDLRIRIEAKGRITL